jgi:SAM-dependent methyltransferase
MGNYYDDNLSAQQLSQVYGLATPKVRQYLEAETGFVISNLSPDSSVLELGCGYGRVMRKLASFCREIVGIDSSTASLRAAQEFLSGVDNFRLARMNAVELGLGNRVFDRVVCIQNGISAFHVNQRALILECLRVTKPDGMTLLSSYSAKFWEARLEWFRLQSEAGLLGPIDWSRTRNGNIVCTDGFTATTVGPDEFANLLSPLGQRYSIYEVDESSIFCVIRA